MNISLKIINRTIVPVFFVIALLMFGCKKKYIKEHYTGTFVFTDHTSHYTGQGGPDTTLVYTKEITFEGKDRNGCLLRIYTWEGSYDVYVDRKGNLTYTAKDQAHESLGGSFSDDNHLQFDWNFMSLSGSSHDHVTAVRQ